jgi:hypothetical protein
MESQQAEAMPSSAPLLDGWQTRAEVAAALGVSTDTLARWDLQRIGPPCVKVGRKVLYRSEAFRDWLKERESGATPAPRKRGRP